MPGQLFFRACCCGGLPCPNCDARGGTLPPTFPTSVAVTLKIQVPGLLVTCEQFCVLDAFGCGYGEPGGTHWDVSCGDSKWHVWVLGSGSTPCSWNVFAVALDGPYEATSCVTGPKFTGDPRGPFPDGSGDARIFDVVVS